MSEKEAKPMTWRGRVVAVDDDTPSPRVAIYDEVAQLVRWFPFRSGLDLASVFRSMSSLEQPLQVSQRQSDQYVFLSPKCCSIESISRDNDSWIVKTIHENAEVFCVSDSNDASESLVRKLRQSRDTGKSLWFVTQTDLKPPCSLRSGSTDPMKTEILALLDTSISPSSCDAKKPFLWTFDESQHDPIDVAHAQELFCDLRRQSTDPKSGPLTGIPFLFPSAGCVQRSHAIARHLLKERILPLKIWVYGTLKFRTRHDPHCQVGWDFHTAPAVWTKSGLLVLDPSVCQEAVSIARWYGNFCPLGDQQVYVVSHHVYWFSHSGCQVFSDPNYHDTEQKLAYIRNALRLQTAAYGFPPCRSS